MHRPELEFSLGRKRTVDGRDTSLTVEFSRRIVSTGNDRRNMNTSETVPPHLLMQNVRDIRKRLMETEKTLNKITKAEAKVDSKYVPIFVMF